MIFQHTGQWVLDRSPHTGEPKTQTRRPAKRGDFIITTPGAPHDHTIVAVERNGRLLYEVGRTYAIQPGRGKHSLGRFRLLAIKHEQARGISEADARAEGFASPAAFQEIWTKLYGLFSEEWLCYALVIRNEGELHR
jgi:hypothetical protein